MDKIRVLRGGSWAIGATKCRAAYRLAYNQTSRTVGGGFRVALSPSVKSPEADIEKK